MLTEERILLVDDEPLIMSAIARRLERLGFAVFQALDAAEVIKIVGNEPVDLVVTDYKMPGMKGTELAAALKRIRPDLPVFIFSGSEVSPSVADGVFAKPDMADLINAIQNRLGKAG